MCERWAVNQDHWIVKRNAYAIAHEQDLPKKMGLEMNTLTTHHQYSCVERLKNIGLFIFVIECFVSVRN